MRVCFRRSQRKEARWWGRNNTRNRARALGGGEGEEDEANARLVEAAGQWSSLDAAGRRDSRGKEKVSFLRGGVCGVVPKCVERERVLTLDVVARGWRGGPPRCGCRRIPRGSILNDRRRDGRASLHVGDGRTRSRRDLRRGERADGVTRAGQDGRA